MRKLGVLLVAAALLAGGCSWSTSDDETGADGASGRGVCSVLATAQPYLFDKKDDDGNLVYPDLTFVSAVKDPGTAKEVKGLSSFLELGRLSMFREGPLRLGPRYDPVVDFLVTRNVALSGEFDQVKEPKRTAEVLASAERLDRDLEAGLCD